MTNDPNIIIVILYGHMACGKSYWRNLLQQELLQETSKLPCISLEGDDFLPRLNRWFGFWCSSPPHAVIRYVVVVVLSILLWLFNNFYTTAFGLMIIIFVLLLLPRISVKYFVFNHLLPQVEQSIEYLESNVQGIVLVSYAFYSRTHRREFENRLLKQNRRRIVWIRVDTSLEQEQAQLKKRGGCWPCRGALHRPFFEPRVRNMTEEHLTIYNLAQLSKEKQRFLCQNILSYLINKTHIPIGDYRLFISK